MYNDDFYKLNYDFYLTDDEIGKLVCVKISNYYYNDNIIYDNSIITKLLYEKVKIENSRVKKKRTLKPHGALLLTSCGSLVEIGLSTQYIDVRIKFY